MYATRKLLILAMSIILSLATSSFAQTDDVDGSSDHPLISRYAGSYIIGYETRDYDELLLPLGKQIMDPESGKRTFEEKQVLEGKLTRILYVAPEGCSSLEVFRNYELALNNAGFQSMFSCSRKECGRFFASTIYQQKLSNRGQMSEMAFVSPEDQRFLAAKLPRAEGDIVVSLYVAVNGFTNFKETYNHAIALLEILEMQPLETGKVTVTADIMARDIDSKGHISLYGIYFDTDESEIKAGSEEMLQEIAELLQQDTELDVFIVGHTDNVGSLEYNLDLSQRRADAVIGALVEQYGVEPSRLIAKGVGPLAPLSSNATEEGRSTNRRVTLVRQ